MHTESVRRFSLTRCTTHCACDHTPSSPCQHPALHTDIHDGPLTTSAELAWTGQDDSTRHQTPPFLSPAKLVPTDPGPRPSRRGHRLGRVSGQLPPTHRRRARTSRPRQRQSTTWANGRWCAVMDTGPPEPAARPPLRPSTRGSAMAPRLHTQRWASQARTGQRTVTTLRDCTTPQEWTSASSGSDAVLWAGWGSPRGVSTFEKVSLAFCAARLRSSLAGRLRRCGFENEKGAGPLASCLCLRPPQPAELNVRAEELPSGTIPSYLP